MKKTLIHSMMVALFVGGSGVALAAGDTSTTQKMESAKDKTVQYVDDSAVTTKVKAALAKDSTTKAHEIKVETTHGVVNLSGEVATQTEISRAGEIARNISGVQAVQNDLRLKAN
ncbi:BON domain-containing protein [Uliginosibacterium sp. sgz301328]|uniref:BON domain-containing protein n=1 Tax=Uliginosibacterium sp. sgz301328 TaxID=3243764 RepID=UPI00359DCB7D